MTADKMFLPVKNLILAGSELNEVPGERMVIGFEFNGEAKAYPIEFIAYHHQIRDTIGGKPVMITYCSVCRTGRIFEPVVNGRQEKFRLVGMDHFNAMFEDETTGSWWRQSTGEAITGELKGTKLPELLAEQMTVQKWFELHPDGLVMQPDQEFLSVYDPEANFEKGVQSGGLTGTDQESWQPKSWVVGVEIGYFSKAYDWNYLEEHRVINDKVGPTPIAIVLAADGSSFAAFERPGESNLTIQNDTLYFNNGPYDLNGTSLFGLDENLTRIKSYQEFWHSWKTFHPNTEKFPD
jgi:hypothetical protein